MRKLKSLLFTAGIATVLAIGVGAGVTTSNRDAIRADADSGDAFTLVSDVTKISPEKDYTFVTTSKNKKDVALGAFATDHFDYVSTKITSNTIVEGNTPFETFKISIDSTVTDNYKYNISLSPTEYIGQKGGDNGLISETDNTSDNAKWALSFNGDKTVKFESKVNGKKSKKSVIQFLDQNKSERFGSYSASQKSIYLYEKQAKVAVSGVSINTPSKAELYVDETLQLTSKVEPANAVQTVNYSIDESLPEVDGTEVISLTKSGLVTALNPGLVSIVATSADGAKTSLPIDLTILKNNVVEFNLTNPQDVAVQYANEPFNPNGLIFKFKRQIGELSTLDNNSIQFTPATLVEGKQNVTATFEDKTVVIENVEALKNSKVSFVKLTSADQVKVGSKLIITNADGTIALSTTQNTNNRGEVNTNLTANSSSITLDSANLNLSIGVFDVEKGIKDGTYSLFDSNKFGYLSAGSTTKNHLKTYYDKELRSSFTFTVQSTGVAIQSADSAYNGLIRHNESSNCFSCYPTSSSCSPVNVYIYTPASDSLEEIINTWANNHLRINDPDFNGDASTAKIDCRRLYKDAKQTLIDLETVYPGATAKMQTMAEINARYVAWANANGDKTPFDGLPFVQAANIFDDIDNSAAIILITVIAILSVSAIAMFAISKRKKATR